MNTEEKLTKEIEALHERNERVEADKAWETSRFRVACIVVVTYLIAALVMYVIGVDRYLTDALIPTIGYLLSTQSLPFLKRWWIKKYYK